MKLAMALCKGMLALCLATAAQAADVLRVRLEEDPDSLYNVQTGSLVANSVLGNFLLERLVYIDVKGLPQPWLAESWQVSPDQKQVTFKLRSGVKFHDGTDLDAVAVKFLFDAIRDPKNASPILPLVGPLVAADVLDSTTLRLSFSKPFAPLFSNLAQPSLGINSPRAVAKSGVSYGRHPVGTGPYRLKRWIPGAEIDLERNPVYRQWRADVINKGPATIGRISLLVVKEEAVATAAFETGELDLASVQPDAVDQVRKNSHLRVITDKRPSNLIFVDFNQLRAPFDNPQFRLAIGHAINRGAVVRAAYGGLGSEALSLLAAGIPGYDEQVSARHAPDYNPAKAKALLSQAGWKLDAGRSDGLLYRNGIPARFVLRSYSGNEAISRTLAVIQADLKSVGIEVKIDTSDWGTFYPSLLNGDWDMALVRWTASDASVLSDLFRSPGHRRSLLPNAAVDAVLDRCNVSVLPAVRYQCVSEAQAILLDNLVAMPVASNWGIVATSDKVRGFAVDGQGYLLSADLDLQP